MDKSKQENYLLIKAHCIRPRRNFQSQQSSHNTVVREILY